MNALQRISPFLLGAVLVLGVLQYTGTVDLFGKPGSDEGTPPPPPPSAERVLSDGELFKQIAAYQAAEKGLYELEKALAAVQEGKKSVEISANGVRQLSTAVSDIMQANNHAIIGRLPCPPVCPPSPCQPGDDFFINCMPVNILRPALANLELLKIDGARKVQFLDGNGKVVAEGKAKEIDKNSVAYALDIPAKVTKGSLVITESMGKQRSVSRMNVVLE